MARLPRGRLSGHSPHWSARRTRTRRGGARCDLHGLPGVTVSDTGRRLPRVLLRLDKPMAHDNPVTEDMAKDDNGQTKRNTVILVEDDKTLRSRMARALTTRGFLVLEAATCESALNLARHVAVQFALVDVQLGRESGIELVRGLASMDPTMTIVVCSGRLSADVARAARAAGATAVLRKPVTLDEILDALPAPAKRPPP